MNDWGRIQLVQITADEFWYLFYELCDDKSGFLNNKRTILQAYKDGTLYGLCVSETPGMCERDARLDDVFCKIYESPDDGTGGKYCDVSQYLLPCFCVAENSKAVILWTHPRARKRGFARTLVELLHILYVWNPLPESIGFWERCNIPECDDLHM